MEIRSATAADVAGLALLVEQYWAFESIGGGDLPRTEQLLTTLLQEPERGGAWVVETAAGLQGYLLAVYLFSLEHGGLMAEIDEFFVAPQLRSTGVGSQLLAMAERDITARGIKQVQLQLGVGNQRGRRFYERHGFRGRDGYVILDKRL
jgi:ribosomal protein S18 acetylase RimI-like enzyme